ncbi:MAG TPA: hypothetical protein VEC02_02860 [Nitrososphaerales archaeon]|nr:hypothetical protein [Nitrososphaerales archaeon]
MPNVVPIDTVAGLLAWGIAPASRCLFKTGDLSNSWGHAKGNQFVASSPPVLEWNPRRLGQVNSGLGIERFCHSVAGQFPERH